MSYRATYKILQVVYRSPLEPEAMYTESAFRRSKRGRGMSACRFRFGEQLSRKAAKTRRLTSCATSSRRSRWLSRTPNFYKPAISKSRQPRQIPKFQICSSLQLFRTLPVGEIHQGAFWFVFPLYFLRSFLFDIECLPPLQNSVR